MTGDYLPTVNLGSDFGEIAEIFRGWFHGCILNTEGKAKCFGDNRAGQLGNGNNDNLGRGENTMGDYLPYLDLGSDFDISHFSGGGSWTVCAVSTENEVKCWGGNGNGNLGIGDTVNRGEAPDQMGDVLPFVDLLFGDQCPAADMYGVNWDDFVCFVHSSFLPL